MAVARALKKIRMATFFNKEANTYHAAMARVINTLTEDTDMDVRSFFTDDSDGESINDISNMPA